MHPRFEKLYSLAVQEAKEKDHDHIMQCFGELIIEDCLRICETNRDAVQYSYTPAKAAVGESTIQSCINIMKRNFGIK